MPSAVSRVMTTEVLSVGEDAAYKEIVDVLLSASVSAVPVLAADGRVAGVVFEQDLLHKEEVKRVDPDEEYWPPLRARLRARLSGAGPMAC
ncbi:CBS domain-containing protein [Nocardiopsis chromatogenes]|uniref:CBS domain-containing protein n=1 Tax=Nocardiopsis chromatogenes TaxID=280239 RepID=UPI000347827A|nr:CBS domain-containing protein [Nocardiopsis chromatogenes]